MDVLNLKLYTISFLDALCIGFIQPILSTHITSLGGTHTTLGILGTCHATFQLFSGPLIRTWRDLFGQKTTLLIILLLNLATYFFMGIVASYLMLICLRLIFASTNQIQALCKSFITTNYSHEICDSIFNIMNALTVSGLILGPIIGGILFENENGFFIITMLSTLCFTICLVICLNLPPSDPVENKQHQTSFIDSIKEKVGSTIKTIQSTNINTQWDILTLKYLYHTSITVFYIKFSLLLKTNYHASSTIVGYTYGYHSALTFLCQFLIAFILKQCSIGIIGFVPLLFLMTVSFFGLCYAPTFAFYLFSFLVMVNIQLLLNSKWKQLFIDRSSEAHKIEGMEDVVAKIVSIVTPVIFGIFCDWYHISALKMFVLVPMLLAIFTAIMFNSEKMTTKEEGREKND